MSCVRFRFKSSLEYDKVTFEGLQISVAELREKIMTQKKLGLSSDFTLEIIDPLNGKGMLGLNFPHPFSLSLSLSFSLSLLSSLSRPLSPSPMDTLLIILHVSLCSSQFTRMTME